MTEVKIVSGVHTVLLDIKKLTGPPAFKTISKLEAVLQAAFVDTQARTHIITGSLKGSGRTSTDYDGKVWNGTITYGGASPGPNNPVDYAIFEMARGGDHDFFGDLPRYYSRMDAAINDHWEI